jgi:hypothetical protein
MIVYANELSFAFEGLDLEAIRRHVRTAIRALHAASLLRGDLRIGLPQPLWQIVLGPDQLTLAAILPGANSEFGLLRRIMDRLPPAALYQENNELLIGGRPALGLSLAYRDDSVGLSFGYAVPWSEREVPGEWQNLAENGNVAVRLVTVRNAATPEHVASWRQHIEEHGRELAASSLVYECADFAARMYFDDHGFPHVHIYRRANDRALIAKVRIDTSDILEGTMSGPLRRAVFEMIERHGPALLESWKRCRNGLHAFQLAEAGGVA